MKILQRAELSAEERLAARLRLSEKRILQGTMDAVRRCVAWREASHKRFLLVIISSALQAGCLL